MPGAAAKAVAASHITNAIAARNRTLFEIAVFIVVSLIAAFLVAGIPERIAASDATADVDLGHEPTEVFSVVRKVVELGSVKIENAPRRIERCRAARGPATGVAGIQNHVKRLAAAERDGVGEEFSVHSRLVAQKFGVKPDLLHRNPQRLQGVIFGYRQVH